MRRLTFILFSAFLFCSCKKQQVYCGLTYLDGLDSKILRLETTGIADTTLAFLHGQVFYYDSVSSEPASSALLYYQSASDSSATYIKTDENGKYKIWLSAGKYNIYIRYFGCNKLVLYNLYFGSGEIKALDAKMGFGIGSTEYYITEGNDFLKKE